MYPINSWDQAKVRFWKCLKKIVTDPYFEVVEVAHMKDAEVRKGCRRHDCPLRHMTILPMADRVCMLGAGLKYQ